MLVGDNIFVTALQDANVHAVPEMNSGSSSKTCHTKPGWAAHLTASPLPVMQDAALPPVRVRAAGSDLNTAPTGTPTPLAQEGNR